MVDKIRDAWYSAKSITAGCGWCIYSDADDNQFAITEVTEPGIKPISRWDDLVYLGQVVRLIKVGTGGSIPENILTFPLTGKDSISPALKTKVAMSSGKAVNDYVCPACHNNKCSKTEKSCWKCGFQFKQKIRK